MFSGKPIDVTDEKFDEVVGGAKLPVIIEFWSPKCTHCQKMAKVVDALAAELAGRYLVVKINVLENASSPVAFGVSNIPAFFLINGGHISARTVGAMPKGKLKVELGIM